LAKLQLAGELTLDSTFKHHVGCHSTLASGFAWVPQPQ
jgi:hypothetical protein